MTTMYIMKTVLPYWERTRKIYRIGNVVKVKLIKADVDARQIEFIIEEDDKEKLKEKLKKSHLILKVQNANVKR